MYSSVALDASGHVGFLFLYTVCILVLAIPTAHPSPHTRTVSPPPSVVCPFLLMLWPDTPSSAHSQWALPTTSVPLNVSLSTPLSVFMNKSQCFWYATLTRMTDQHNVMYFTLSRLDYQAQTSLLCNNDTDGFATNHGKTKTWCLSN